MSYANPSNASIVFSVFLPLLVLGGCGGGGDAPAGSSAPPVATAAQVATAPTEAHLPPAADEAAVSAEARQRFAALPVFHNPVDSIEAEVPAPFNETIQLASNTTPLTATFNATAYWPVWYGNGRPVDGVNCLANGNWHKHALISIYNNGKRLGFPDRIGRLHAGCYHAYEMHVHDVSGIIHMEADVPKQFKLGQWFSLWQQPLSRDNVAGLPGPVRFYIVENGTVTRYDGDPYQIDMVAHREILIVTGAALSVVPRYQWPLGF